VRLTSSLLTVALAAIVPLASLSGAASAHPSGSDFWDGTYAATDVSSVEVITGSSDVPITRQSDNVAFVAHVPVGPTSDMQHQRREGRQVLGGQVIDRRLDLVVLGGTATPGVSIIDVTSPQAPVVLTTISCGGFHSDVAIYQNYLIQSWDGANRPCEEREPANRYDVDRPADKGLRIFDVTDPAKPVLVKFFGREDGIPAGVHNITVNGDDGLLYLNMAEFNSVDPPWGFVDLDDPELPLTMKSIRDWSPTAADGCHDAGIAPKRQLLACAGITASYIWDISDPRQPVEVAVIANPSISIHHGARWTPDEMLLVLGDELAGAATDSPCTGGTERTPVGATWFYDAAVAAAPVLLGTFSVSDTEGEYCTSHFYGFVEGTTLMPTGWYDAGIEIVDYGPVAGGLPGIPTSHAVFEPEGGAFFSAYAWHGYVYGSSFEYGAEGGIDDAARGLWIVKVDGIDDVAPSAVDEGIAWGRWGSVLPADIPLGPFSVTKADVTLAERGLIAGAVAVAPASAPLPVTGGGVVALGGLLVAGADLLRRRRRTA
jgi:hypothetical protein